MKTFGYIKYPDVTVKLPKIPPYKEYGKVLDGWNRGRCLYNNKNIIFEDVFGSVHVVQAKLFYS